MTASATLPRQRLSNSEAAASVHSGAGVIAFSAVHRRLRWKGEDTRFYGIGFEDGTMFLSRRQPPVFDAQNKRIRAAEIQHGTTVNVLYRVDGRVNWVDAIQVVRFAEEESPFMPVMEQT